MNDLEGSKPSVGEGGAGTELTAIEVARDLQIIVGSIKDDKIKKDLQDIISKISHGSVQERSYNILTENLRSFVTNLGSSVHFSLGQTKQIIKTIIVLWNKPSIAKHVMKEVYNEDIGDATEVPNDVKNMDEKAIEIYSKALKDGEEEIRNIRLMVLGMFGVGKTSLVNNLIKDFRDKNIEPQSTEGIDLHRCQLMENGDWCLDDEHKLTKYQSRFKKGFNEITIPRDMNVPDDSEPIEPMNDKHVASNIPVTQSDTRSLETITKSVKEHIKQEIVRTVLPIVEVQPMRQQEIEQVSLKSKTNTTVSVWDFAGQTLYYSTHQFFLNKRSIYLVLMDMTKSLDDPVKEDDEASGIWLMKDCTYLDVFKFWLNAIHMYSGHQSSVGNLMPSIILVGTRKDEMTGKHDEKEMKTDMYFEEALRRAFAEGSPILQHIHPRKFLVNNLSHGDPVFNQLRKEILRLAQKQKYWGEKSPLRWIPLEQTLDTLRDERKQLLKMEDIEHANESNAHPLGGDELKLFLEIQHRHGNILYFNTDKLKNLIVLAPQWIIQAFKCFITHIMHKNPKNFNEWNDYMDLAILKHEVFTEIMDNSDKTISDNREDVIKYMEHLDVMAKPLKLEEVKEAECTAADHQTEEDKTEPVVHGHTKYLDFHIVPCRLKKPPPPISNFTSPPESHKKTQILCFVFCEKFMPPSFFHRLVAVCIRTWPISQEDNKNQLYNGLAVFDLRPAYTLTIWYKDHIIYARISSFSRKSVADFDVTLCEDVRHTLQISLLNFVGHSEENPGAAAAFEEYIQCPSMQEFLPNKGMLRVKEFMYENELNCKSCPKRHTVERAEALQYWFKHELEQTDKKDDNLNRPVQDSDLLNVAKSVCNEFWMLGIEIGLKEFQMNQLYEAPECRRDHCTFVYKYLVKWRNTAGEKSTLQFLNRAINAARLSCSKSHTPK
ncbi:uncharacterized protein LOC127868905 isoform X3 [Dreissena polymorpha]|uniref:non-specific serine/threonine protein kinase n=1 Tax=Dreissena polymorpha TaxID=45954 RepID=A0A9D4MA99_DREPO|nr:uncharacterized protein LOC127868905 isoform X3 [Dreissena polymorpha]XP_052267015.1 uncharacterized protein LOC127868905 isoform X3 [Dreissena polymorpha]XP_052267017.1 uncharacterized protein LOC127868905 isoform X3 [Dreissena polymorpha]KAH3872978.1 hypothetical protein DPMN_036202 [Dreissena polymorpha]